VEIIAQNSGKCLQISYTSMTPNYWLQQMTCNGGVGQLWTFLQQSDGSYQIKSVNSNLLLYVKGGSLSPGASIVQYKPSSSLHMNWTVQPDSVAGNYKIAYQPSGDCMDIQNANTKNSAAVLQEPCTGKPNESFQLVDDHNVALSWDASTSTGVKGYYVYRGSSASGPFTKLSGMLSDLSFVDGTVATGQTYYYVTTATDGTLESAYSNSAQAIVP
jgi:Ricin-type beta-trefoil lectin domain-like